MKQREAWKARAPVLACSTAHSPSSTAFLTVQILQTQNSVLSVEAKAKTGAKVKDSAKKTEHEAKGEVESEGTCASLLHSSLSFRLCSGFPPCANPANQEQCIVSGSKGEDRSKGES
eukprot:1841088-Rhodomonas_salina.1